MSSDSLKKMGTLKTLKKAEAASLQQVQRWLEDLGLSPDRPEDQVLTESVCVSLLILSLLWSHQERKAGCTRQIPAGRSG